MADVSERLSDFRKKQQARDVQVITHTKKKKKKENINRGSNAEQKQGNRKKKKDSRQLSCN